MSTPIGNLEDITIRAVKVLFSSEIIFCEDTRKTGQLLSKLRSLDNLEINSGNKTLNSPKLISFFEGNEIEKIPLAVSLVQGGANIALVSNGGTPLVSDPGFKLVREAIRQDIKVETIPGASAVLTALTVSGLPTDKFLFLGFLPKKPVKRQKIWQNLNCFGPAFSPTVIIYESPFRLIKTLNELLDIYGDIEITIARELTKMYEEVRREKISNSVEHFSKTKPKGEFCLLFNLFKENI